MIEQRRVVLLAIITLFLLIKFVFVFVSVSRDTLRVMDVLILQKNWESGHARPLRGYFVRGFHWWWWFLLNVSFWPLANALFIDGRVRINYFFVFFLFNLLGMDENRSHHQIVLWSSSAAAAAHRIHSENKIPFLGESLFLDPSPKKKGRRHIFLCNISLHSPSQSQERGHL